MVAKDKDAAKSASKHSTGHLKGRHGVELFYQEWSPPRPKLRGVVLLVHGYAEHGGRYERFADDLVPAGYAVGVIDHRGHGRSGGKRVQVDKFDDYVDDLDSYAGSLRKRFPAPLPLFVVGHSMGGLIALRYVTRDKPEIAGVAVSGAAASKPDDVSSLTILVGNTLATVAPDVGVVGLKLEKISRDPQVVADYFADPLTSAHKIRARLGSEMIKAMTRTEQDLPSLTFPILIMHGGDDQIATPDGSRLIEAKVASEDKTLKIYDGLWHEVFNEPERDVVIGDLVTWLNRQVATAG